MAGIITALKIQARNKERVNVFVDDQFAFAVTAVAAAALKKGQYLSDAEIEEFKSGDQLDKAYDQAIRYLGFRPRSQAEVERYLHEKDYPANVIVHTLERLRQQQYVDDQAFAQFWLENRERFKPRGRQALRYELRQKGLESDLIDEALTGLDEEESAWAAAESKLPRWRTLDEPAFKQKVMAFLNRRGFTYEVASQTAQRAWNSLDSAEFN
ncbi:MAG: RecX family transcriptional regulator [Anaerolineae bacterium]